MSTAAPTEITEADAIEAFARAMVAISQAMSMLEAVGLDPVEALKRIPTEEGRTMYDELPPQFRMLLG